MNLEKEPSVVVHSQYVKDLSFEGPNDITRIKLNKSQPKIAVNFDVKVESVENISHVSLFFHIEAAIEDENIFILELVYVGVFSLNSVHHDRKDEVLLTACAAMLFPFARQVIASTISSAGFPPVMIDYINFAEFYRNKMSRGQHSN
jgi:preprotein translocase subunit SecB